METMEVISSDKATVVIQVNPQVEQDSVIFVDGQKARGTNLNAALKGFFKVQPKALGIVQIMNGVMIFILGVVFTITINVYNHPSVLFSSGITYWGSLIYISAGSLSVAAQNNLHPCIVKASLGMNVFSAITAGLAILLMSIQLIVISAWFSILRAEGSRIIEIMLVFTIPQFIISICISAFACKATSDTDSTVVNVTLN